jgi:hypothetical protein
MPSIELGARLKGIDLQETERVAYVDYELVEPDGAALGCGGEIRIPYETLDVIDARLGGREALTPEERVDLVGKIVQPLFVGRFNRTEIPPPPPAPVERKDAFVEAHGAVVDAVEVLSVPKGA